MKTAIILKRLALLMIVLSMAYGCVSIPRAEKTLKPSDFKGEIARVQSQKSLQNHYKLAVLYSHYNNPAPDFKAAASELRIYLKSKPTGPLAEEARCKLDLLERITAHRETIEKLKDLDMTIEKRRKGVR